MLYRSMDTFSLAIGEGDNLNVNEYANVKEFIFHGHVLILKYHLIVQQVEFE